MVRVLQVGLAFVLLTVATSWRQSFADTMVPVGDIGGQVWTADKGPYHVSVSLGGDRLTIAAAETLRIEAGTKVYFADGTGAIGVLGTLIIAGTKDAPVSMQAEPGTEGRPWGIQAPTMGGSITIENAIIRDAVFGIQSYSPNLKVDYTTFENCQVGISVWAGTVAFDSIVLRNNDVGMEVEADRVDPPTSVTLTNALLQGNKSYGVITQGSGSVTVINSTIDGSMVGIETALGPQFVPPIDVQNCILSNNRTAIFVGVNTLALPTLSVKVVSSTFWMNKSNSSTNNEGTLTVVGPADAPAGAGNVAADPKYLSATDLHLGEGSPCVDSGIAARAPDHDVEGNVRPQGAAVDRGAFEHVPGMGGSRGAGGGAGAGTTGSGGAGAGGSSSGGASGQEAGGGGASGAGDRGRAGSAGAAGSFGGGGRQGAGAGAMNNGEAGAAGGDSAGGGAGVRSTGSAGGAGATGEVGGGAHPASGGRDHGCGCGTSRSDRPSTELALGIGAVIALIHVRRRRAEHRRP